MNINIDSFKGRNGFSLVELLVVVTLIVVLTGTAIWGLSSIRNFGVDSKVRADLVAIANAIEAFERDQNSYPIPALGGTTPVLCFYADATYAHDCVDAYFVQSYVDRSLLPQKCLSVIPLDPRTGSRYVYGVSTDSHSFQIAGVGMDGGATAYTTENLSSDLLLPSLIRAYDSANMVVDGGIYLPYSPNHLVLSGTLHDVTGTVTNGGGTPYTEGAQVFEGDQIITGADGLVDLYLSDGSIVQMEPNSDMNLSRLAVNQNDENGTVTNVLLKLNLGKIWSKVVRLSQNSEFRVETTNSIAGCAAPSFPSTLKVICWLAVEKYG
ncbi:FecR domain-containing protein [Candidatus Peregrinibacteria bacterium]|nr:MAG: FecR domain-containing protein [Candidatus Peregrinibacteria bacterium]